MLVVKGSKKKNLIEYAILLLYTKGSRIFGWKAHSISLVFVLTSSMTWSFDIKDLA